MSASPLPEASTSTAANALSASTSQSATQRQQSTRCLHVSNLESSIDEYLLLRLFKPYGKITKLDFVRHKVGPHKGKPRGFAFVEYETSQEALKALQAVGDKIIKGKKLRMNFANVSEGDSNSRRGKDRDEASKPTALSLLKSRAQPESTNGKIKALEAKLRRLQQQKEADAQAAQGRTGSSKESAELSAQGHPSGLSGSSSQQS